MLGRLVLVTVCSMGIVGCVAVGGIVLLALDRLPPPEALTGLAWGALGGLLTIAGALIPLLTVSKESKL